MPKLLIQEKSPKVKFVNGQLTTTSLNVAEVFGKQHKDVLRVIETKISKIDKEFSQRNFTPRDYLDERGKTNKLYILTQDGFSFLVMGFTGVKADNFKIAYIQEFNRMRENLKVLSAENAPTTLSLSTTEDRKPLKSIVDAWAKQANLMHSTCWKQVSTHFQLERISELPTDWIDDAIYFVQTKIDALQKALPQVEQKAFPSAEHLHSQKLIEIKNKYLKAVNNVTIMSNQIRHELSDAYREPVSIARKKIYTSERPLMSEEFTEAIYSNTKKIEKLGEEFRETFLKAVNTGISIALMQEL